MVIQFDEDKQKIQYQKLREEEEEKFLEIAASNQQIPYIDLSIHPIDNDALRLMDEKEATSSQTVPFTITGKKLGVASRNPSSETTKAIAGKLQAKGFIITLYLTSKKSIDKAISKYKELSFSAESLEGSIEMSPEAIASLINELTSLPAVIEKIKSNLSDKKSYRISRVVEIMVAGAIALDASDIHIEPEETYVRIRYRLDGVLNNILEFDLPTFHQLLARIKLISGMKLNIKDEAQDGRFSVKIKDTDIEIRASVIPGAYSESIVLRILNPKSISLTLDKLGLSEKLMTSLNREIGRPNGMILTTGPTGSGKTTTLYAFLRQVHNPETKIITIEDPIEYHLPGIVQTQTDTDRGYTFALGLRAAVRQDPDIIMVGEIRDNETAEVAVNAALTGHLVFSTLHTNNAAGAFPRLIDLGVNPKVLTSAITVSMAQRLIRKLCENCKQEKIPTPAERSSLEKIMSSIKDESQKAPVGKIFDANPKGCEKCHNGYKGRIGVYEAILTDEKIEQVVIANPSEREIKKAAEDQGILDMTQDGVIKVLKGVTSLSELSRVVNVNLEP